MTARRASRSLAIGAASHVGRVRKQNEDAFIAEPMVVGVADGMGGHQAGEVASAIAVRTLRDRLASGATDVDVAVSAVVEANTAIYRGAHSNPAQRGMGTTLTAMIVLDADAASDPEKRRFVLMNVGDSRTYLLRGFRMRRITVDHSYVQELVSTGHITEIEARTHPRRNIVTRALGIEPTVRVDTWVFPFVRGDRFLLCSDGLVDEVTDDEIAEIASGSVDPQAAADALVAAANRNGGRDNVTVVVVDVIEGGVSADNTADLDLDLVWIDQSQPVVGSDVAVDADAADPVMPMVAPAASPPRRQLTEELPITKVARVKVPRHYGIGTFLFAFTGLAIVTLAITFVLAVRNNKEIKPVPLRTTTAQPTTTVPRTTTTSSPPTTTTPGTTTTTVALGG
ncbi:MAG: Stp1/IreP family PP2C-type Ser/Thr phosphatase [Actinobacteria bacterium]|nr:Stp1/IreP family PP2C-type Ser/Thr phosphatase [Actinomycetota bacterium]